MDLNFKKLDWENLSDAEVAAIIKVDNLDQEGLVDYYLMALNEFNMASGVIDDIAAYRDRDDVKRYDRIVRYMEQLPEVKLYLIREEKLRLRAIKRKRLVALKENIRSLIPGVGSKNKVNKSKTKKEKKGKLIFGLKRKK